MDRHLYAYRELDVPWQQAVDALTEHRAALFGDATDATVHGAVTRLHTTVAGLDVGRDVTVRLGPIRDLGMHTVSMALTWDAVDGHGIFPRMLGSIELTAMSDHPARTQLTFLGTYTPPLGVVGTIVDAAAGHKVADDTIDHFIDEVATRLAEFAPTA